MQERLEEIFSSIIREVNGEECRDILARILDIFVIDPFLRIPNRLYFDLFLSRELSIANRYGLPVGVLFLDVDGLKRINDTYGHIAGDAYLKAVVVNIQSTLRSSDLLIRWGGDEFVALLHTNMEGLVVAKRRIKERLRSAKISLDGDVCSLSVSVGCAEVRGGNIVEAIKEADEEMYKNKRRKERYGDRTEGAYKEERVYNGRRL
ncbi:diguanylate cyclase [Hydrogenivirga sp.]